MRARVAGRAQRVARALDPRPGARAAVDAVRVMGAELLDARRRTWAADGLAWLETRPLGESEHAAFEVAIQAAFDSLPAVGWARYNGALRRVVVRYDPAAVSVRELARVLTGVERDLGMSDRLFDQHPAPFPADPELRARLLAESGADLVALGLGLALRAWLRPTPAQIDLAALLRVLEGVPPVRSMLDNRLGRGPVDLAVSVANSLNNAVMPGLSGPLTDLAYRQLRLQEQRALDASWLRAAPGLAADPESHVRATSRTLPRPSPPPRGPIERYTDQAVTASLGGFGAGLAATRRVESATAMLFSGIPKPARLGRNAWASALGRRLALEGVVVRRAGRLRWLDRVDTLVVDVALLEPIGGEIVAIRAVGATPIAEVRRRCVALFRHEAPFARREHAGWTLERLSAMGAPFDRDVSESLRAEAAPAGRILGLSHDGVLQGMVAIRPEVAPDAQALVDAARRADLELVAAGHDARNAGWAEPISVVRDAEGVQALRGEGRGVLVVASDPSLPPAADVSLAVARPGARVAWEGDLIAPQGLAQAVLIVAAVPVAREVAEQSVRIAIIEALAGLTVALQGTDARAARRTMDVSNVASLLALGNAMRIVRGLRVPPFVPREHTPWHALDADVVFQRLHTRPGGLSPAEAEARREPPEPPPSTFDTLLRTMTDELATPLTPVLAMGATLSGLTGSAIDPIMVGAILVINAAIGGVQRMQADRELRAIDRRERLRARVRRGGELLDIEAAELVPGDVVLLAAGDLVPADARLVEASRLEVDESVITGESLPVAKDATPSYAPVVADRTSIVHAGSTVVAGEGVAVVVATGEDTVVGRAAAHSTEAPSAGGVEARLEGLTRSTATMAEVGALAVLLSGLLHRRPPTEFVGAAVSMAVAAVPEGLPLLTMLAQLAAARRLAAHGVFVRNVRAIEALGRVDVLCADKTGTLTEGRIALQVVSDGEHEAPLDELDDRLRGVLGVALRASPDATGARPIAHPTDRAILEAARAVALGPSVGRSGWKREDELPFQPSRGWHATLGAHRGRALISVKGAPEVVVPRCDRYGAAGRTWRMTEARREVLHQTARRMASQGLRVLALAERPVAAGRTLADDQVTELIFRGFVGLADPPRPSARDAIEALRRAGVHVRMITGDHPTTAAAVARAVGLEGEVLTGAELDRMDDAELVAQIERVRVFARVAPEQKRRIVEALRAAGRRVAMTGDGANDVPAIRLADVGIALGPDATQAARHAADLVVTDERIDTLVTAVIEGRALWAAVSRAVAVLVGGNIGELAFTLAGGLGSGRSPLNARQLLLVNLLTDALPALVLAVSPPESADPDALANAVPEEALGSKLERDIAVRAAATGLATTAVWTLARWTGDRRGADTIALLTLIGTQLAQTLAAEGERPLVAVAAIGSALLTLGLVETPGLSHALGCRPVGPIGLSEAMIASVLGAASVTVGPKVVRWARARVPDEVRNLPVAEPFVRLVTESRLLRRVLSPDDESLPDRA